MTIEALALSLFIFANNITLATPAQQVAAWHAQSQWMQAAYLREARYVIARNQ